jgi:hypothetical protein
VASEAAASLSVQSPASFHVTRITTGAPCHRARIIAGHGEAWPDSVDRALWLGTPMTEAAATVIRQYLGIPRTRF